MRNRRRTLRCARTAALLAAAAIAARAGPAQDASAARLELLIPRLMKDGDVPGLSIALIRDGRVTWHRAFGVRDASAGGAVGDDTIFEAASLSKPVFAYAVLKLVDAGRIDLDAPVERYLPGDYVRDKRISEVTVRRVLSHTAGFPNWRPDGEPLRILFNPGEKFSYSGEGFVYLQKAVERTTGRTLDAVMEELVFRPLHMADSSYVWQPRFEGRKATGHNAIGIPRELERPSQANAAASLQTTALDYARFLTAVLNGTGLAAKTLAEMWRPQIQVDESCTNCADKKPGRLSREIAWGLGWGLEENSDGIAVWHWGDNGSGFHCFVLGQPKDKSGVVIFTNSLDGHGIIPDILEASVGGKHPQYSWIHYERYDSAPRTWFKAILARGAAAVAEGPSKGGNISATLTEEQVNRVGYWLLASKRVADAIAVFGSNVATHPDSWNVHDSLGEAYARDGQRERAIASYEKSLALNPDNNNGKEALQRLRAQAGK